MTLVNSILLKCRYVRLLIFMQIQIFENTVKRIEP